MLGRCAEDGLDGGRHPVDDAVTHVQDHISDVLGEQPETLLGGGDVANAFHPLGDVAPGQGDQVTADVVSADVVVPGTGEDLVLVVDLVDDDRLVRLDALCVPPDQSGESDLRHRLQHGATDQCVATHSQVVAHGAVDVAVDEIGDPPGGVPYRLQQRLGVEHPVRRRAKQVVGVRQRLQRPGRRGLVVEDPRPASKPPVLDGCGHHQQVARIAREAPHVLDLRHRI